MRSKVTVLCGGRGWSSASVPRDFPRETFSESFSHTEKCQLCTKCTGLLRMSTPCTDTNDAICTCNYGYYHNKITERCEACTKCPEGRGMLYSCGSDQDTVCESCDDDTFSDQDSFRDPCIPCTTCDEGDEVLQDCSPVSDTVCQSVETYED
ncbi:hypothetical protein CCH79_00017469 [Gambusia affinis]|uniref:TNFR-Cys domain-containing protein n=1 Tax=Gambusia affinis TaxID=33528 RepID=A0A315V1J2_GAMAF|nr:hypothetical protein CCH79_00017469 [Gambusia affinis]